MSRKLNTDEVIKQFQKVHGDKYNYSLVEYKTCQEKVKIICPIHGIFEQTPLEHKHGQSCPKCSHRKKLDAAKLEKCNSNNIKIVYINYSDNDEEIKEKIYKICNCLY